MTKFVKIFLLFILFYVSCNKNENSSSSDQSILDQTFKGSINLTQLENYSNQSKPAYITRDNTNGNQVNDAVATLGRVLFYDKKLSVNNSVSCGSCHKQEFAFGDTATPSKGVAGNTSRQSMRLINSRFSEEIKFFWDERASSLENQSTQPIKDHVEMGFSGTNGDPNFANLITKLSAVDYYKILFKKGFGSEEISEQKIQTALSQFIRSIQSFDAKYDVGRAQVNNDLANFPNFTAQENQGKNLFITRPTFDANSQRTSGGLGCGGCHRAPEFDIDPNSRSNGIGGSIQGGPDFTNTKAPSLRNITKTNGTIATPLMHTGVIKTIQAAIGHYGNLTAAAANNTNLDNRLKPNNIGQQLNLNAQEVNAVEAFLKTLSGSDVFTNKKWSNPFP
jgi:cytochrome c peroxidase